MAEYTPEGFAAALDKVVTTMPRLADELVRKTAFDVQGTAQQLAPYDTGNLKNSITVEVLGKMSAAVGPTAHYGRYVEEGTAPHIIRPRSAKVLYFNGVFTSRVSHPGTKAQPFMAPAAKRHVPRMLEEMGRLASAI